MNNSEAMQAAARQLAIRPLTEKQLRDKLAEKEFAERDIEAAIDKMLELGALDDAAYAADFAESRTARGWGAVRIKYELRSRGVDEEITEAVLAELSDPTENIVQLITQKLRHAELTRELRQKISASLARKGFTWEQIKTAFERLGEEEE